MTAMRVKRVRRLWQVMGALAVEVAQGDCPPSRRVQDDELITVLKAATKAARPSWPVRMARKCVGIVMSLRSAWAISRASLPTGAAPSAPRPRFGRDLPDVSGGNLSEG
jgi:hypothetical protein